MQVEVQRIGDTAVVTTSGELDPQHADQLRECLTEIIANRPGLLVIDLSDVTFVDSTILGVLVGARKRLGPDHDRIRLVVHHPAVLKIFQLTGLTQVFALSPTLQEALP